jgi:hypothetical protein
MNGGFGGFVVYQDDGSSTSPNAKNSSKSY